MAVLIAVAVGLAAVFALVLLFGAVSAVIQTVRDQRGWTSVTREIICTDARMLGDAFRLSLAHFQAVNELRKRGGQR